ncbi:MAG: methyltransferase domain-containing protein [Planctomycetota bacterium]
MDRSNRRFHDRISKRYDDVYDTAYWRFYRDVSWRHLLRFVPAARPGWAADLGCGTGWFGRRLRKAGLHVVFLDPSGGMLDAARGNVEADRDRGDTRYVQAGLEDMSALDEASLDFATAQGDPLSFCADPKRAMAELRRVLKPGAHAVLSVDNRVAGVRTLLDEGDLDGGLALLRTGRTRWRARDKAEEFGMKMFTPSELRHLTERSGFAWLSCIAKTCLVQRRHEAWLEDRAGRLRLLEREEAVHAEPEWLGLGSHLQFAVRRDA